MEATRTWFLARQPKDHWQKRETFGNLLFSYVCISTSGGVYYFWGKTKCCTQPCSNRLSEQSWNFAASEQTKIFRHDLMLMLNGKSWFNIHRVYDIIWYTTIPWSCSFSSIHWAVQYGIPLSLTVLGLHMNVQPSILKEFVERQVEVMKCLKPQKKWSD